MSDPFVDDFDDDVTVAARPSTAAATTPRPLDDFDDDVTVAARPQHRAPVNAPTPFDDFDDDVTVAASQATSYRPPPASVPSTPSGLSAPSQLTPPQPGEPMTLPAPPPSTTQWRPPSRLSAETVEPVPDTSQRTFWITAGVVAAVSILAATFAVWFFLIRSSDEGDPDPTAGPYYVELGVHATQP